MAPPVPQPAARGPSAVGQLRSITRKDRVRVARTIDSLARDPRPPGVEKLRGTEDLWRVRVGEYRIIYAIRDDVLLLLVVRLGHRREVYRRRP